MSQCQSWIGVDGLMLRCTKRRGHYGGKRKHKNGRWRWWWTNDNGEWKESRKKKAK